MNHDDAQLKRKALRGALLFLAAVLLTGAAVGRYVAYVLSRPPEEPGKTRRYYDFEIEFSAS